MKNFVSPHVHIQSLDSASTPEAFAKRELELGSGALVVTDHGTLTAVHKVYSLGKAKGLIPIAGLEAYHRDDRCTLLTAAGYPKNSNGAFTTAPKYSHITMHALDQAAYECMVKLLSQADARLEETLSKLETKDRNHGQERKPLFNWDDLEELGGHNVTMSSGCLIGIVPRHLLDNDDGAMAGAYFDKLKSIVKPGNFFVELFPHDCSKNWVEGVFLTMADGTKLRFYTEKWLRTDAGEIQAAKLAKAWRDGEHHTLKSIKDRNMWREMPEQEIKNVTHVEDFLQNECRKFAADGDLQAGINRFMRILAKRNNIKCLPSDDCLAKGTLVRCNDTYRPVEFVEPGHLVVAHDGSIQTVEATRGFFTNKPCIIVHAGGIPVTLTEDHRVWVKKGIPNGRVMISLQKNVEKSPSKWENAGALVQGDLLFVPLTEWTGVKGYIDIDFADFINHRWRYTKTDTHLSVTNHVNGTPHTFQRKLRVSDIDAWILGFFVGDGNAHNNLSSFVAEKDTYEILRPKLLELAHRLGMPFDEIHNKKHSCFRIINTAFTQFLRRSFYDLDKNKKIPEWVFEMAPAWVRSFCAGMLYADGSSCISSSGITSYSLSMTSLRATSFVRDFLLSQGLYVSFSSRMTTGGTKTLYTINIPQEGREVLNLWGEEQPPRQKRRFIKDTDGYWIRIQKIEKSITTPTLVYDLQVSNTGSFSTAAFAVHNSHYAYSADKVVQDMRLAQSGSWRFFDDYSRLSSEQAFAHFKKTLGTTEKEFEGWVDNSHEWADRFKGFVLDTPVSIPTKFYDTQYELQPWFKEQGHPDNSVRYTMDLIRKHGRMDWKDPVRVARLRAEINLLHNNGKLDLLPYMFLGEEVCSQYEQAGLLVGPGRGSAAGLGLAYLLGITHVDPLKYGLSMDRFLTADRIRSGKMPDIDIDFPNRDLLVNPVDGSGWLKERFGDHFAQLSVDITLKMKMAIKDMARTNHQRCDTCSKTYNKSTNCCGHSTKGFVPPDLEALTKKLMMPPMGITDLDFALGYDTDEGHMQGSVEYDPALQDYIKRYPKDWEVVQKALGLSRSRGRHACSFVVANKPISSFIPLTTVSGVRVTSYTAASVEAVGGLKMDYLVVTVLSDISDAIKMVQTRVPGPFPAGGLNLNGKFVPGHRVVALNGSFHDIWDLPEDQAVFADIATGKTETVFQLSTPGAKQWLEQFSYKKPNGNYAIDSIEGMAAFTALDRPGPLDARVTNPEDGSKHNLLVEYARRARGAPGSKDVLPVFDRLLPETYGVVVFQESIEKMYREITGCSGSEAEAFRTLVAKKQMEKLQKLYTPFIEAASKTLTKEEAESVFQQWVGFGAYSFNKSHAVCYSVIGYACAWLKHHYPLEWWTAVLRNADKNEISEKFWRHCGHLIDLPDLKLSGGKFEIQNERVRAPVSLLHGIGEAASNQLIAGMPYADVSDFCRKIEKHRQDTGEWVMKPKKVKENKRKDPDTKKFIYDESIKDVRTFKKGHSSLHSGVIKTLILSGAMDSLFPPEMHVGEQFVEFERAFAEAVNASAEVTGAKKVKPKKVDPKDWDLDPIQRYQKRKEILPAYSTDLIKLLFQVKCTPDLQIDQISGLPVFLWIPPHSEKTVALSVVGAKEVDRLSGLRIEEGRSIQVAVCAHVDDARVFRYGEERKEACELQLDVDGARYKYVRWSGKEGALPAAMKVPLKGAVVVAVLNRFRDGKPFAISDVVIVKPPLDEAKEEEIKEGEPNDEQ